MTYPDGFVVEYDDTLSVGDLVILYNGTDGFFEFLGYDHQESGYVGVFVRLKFLLDGSKPSVPVYHLGVQPAPASTCGKADKKISELIDRHRDIAYALQRVQDLYC